MPSLENPIIKSSQEMNKEKLSAYLEKESAVFGSLETAKENIDGLSEAMKATSDGVGRLVQDKKKSAEMEQILLNKDQAI